MTRIRWGVLGAARIATRKVIPSMQRAPSCEVVAIASRDLERARAAAGGLGIAKAYGSYQELLEDPAIDAVYNPLPNHLHVPWTIRAAEAGKHVLVETPVALTAADAEQLIPVRDRTGRRIQEAFMVRTHPQWLEAQRIVRSGRLGEARAITGFFSYYNDDAANIRNVPDWGGGGLMDIGCYLVNIARLLLEREPLRVAAACERDPHTGVDRLTSLVLDFGTVHAIGTCGTQLVPYQRVQVMGTRARLDVEIPFNAPLDEAVRLFVDDGSDVRGHRIETIGIAPSDQYLIQGELFSRAILDGTPAPYPLEDSVANMRVVDALFASARDGSFVTIR
jgi:predicted dehydrogenase